MWRSQILSNELQKYRAVSAKPVECVVHTVFRLTENCFFIREWINYHHSLGVSHFYLYDNSKSAGYWRTSTGLDGSNETQNKWNFPFHDTFDEKQVEKEWSDILRDFAGMITVVKWEPFDEKTGKVVYNQPQAISHYFDNFASKSDSDWTICMDMDELIVSSTPLLTLLSTQSKKTGVLKMGQKLFEDRFCAMRPMHKIEKCVVSEIGNFYHKNIIRNSHYVKCHNIHTFDVKGDTIHTDRNELRFNHYSYNKKRHGFCTVRWEDKLKFEVDNSLKYLNVSYCPFLDENIKHGNNPEFCVSCD